MTVSRDEGNWAKPVERLEVTDVPEGALNLNVHGRRVAGFAGFGKMWQKTYRIELGTGVTPAEVIRTWKDNFPSFWPPGNKFYAPLTGISPGDVAIINMKAPGVKLSTGVLVMYADDESFSFMTPEGHMFAGMVTFSAAEGPDGTFVQVQAIIRAQDPLYELAMGFGGHRKEDAFWEETLGNLAKHFGVDANAATVRVCVDKRRAWKKVGNIRYNAALRSGAYAFGKPVRAMRRSKVPH